MSILARHFLALYLRRAAWVFAFAQVFCGLCAMLAFAAADPFVSPLVVARVVPDLLLLVAPICITVATFGGALLFIIEARRCQGFLWVALAGRDPRTLTLPIVFAGALASLASAWLLRSVVPNVEHEIVTTFAEIGRDAPGLALRAALHGPGVKGLEVGFEDMDESGVSGLTIVAERGRTAIAARRARFELADEGHALSLSIEDGRLLRIDESGALESNVRFERLLVTLDAASFGAPPKSELLALGNYTDEELDRLVDLVTFRLSHGIATTDRQRARIDAIPVVRAARLASAATPLVLLAPAILLLVRPSARGERALTIAIVLGAALVVIPFELVTLHLASNDRLESPLVPFVPAAIAAVATLIGMTHSWWRGR